MKQDKKSNKAADSKLLCDLDSSTLVTVANYAAGCVVTNQKLKNFVLDQYNAWCHKISGQVKTVLDGNIPVTIHAQSRMRADYTKITAVLYRMVTERDAESQEFYHTFCDMAVSCLPRVEKIITNVESDPAYRINISMTTGGPDSMYLAIIYFIVRKEERVLTDCSGTYTLELFTELVKRTFPCRSIFEGFELDKQILKEANPIIGQRKQMSDYVDWWAGEVCRYGNEIVKENEEKEKDKSKEIAKTLISPQNIHDVRYGTRNKVSSLKTDIPSEESFGKGVAYIDPFAPFYVLLELCGLSPALMMDSMMITKQMNLDACFAAVSAILDRQDIHYVLTDNGKTKPSQHRQNVKDWVEKDDWLLSASYTTALTFTYALQLRMMLERYVQEVKNAIRYELENERKDVQKTVNKRMLDSVFQKKLDDAQERLNAKEKENDMLARHLVSAKNRESAIQSKLEEKERECERLQKLLEEATRNTQAEVSPEVRVDCETELGIDADGSFEIEDALDVRKELDSIFDEKKIVFIGGNLNIVQKFQQQHPNAIMIEQTRIASCDAAVRNADAVLFKVDSISHSMYTKCKSLAQNAGVPTGYVKNVASVERMEKSVYNELKAIFDTQKSDK